MCLSGQAKGNKHQHSVACYVNERKAQTASLLYKRGLSQLAEGEFYTSDEIFCDTMFPNLREAGAERRLCRINDRQVDGEAEKHIIVMSFTRKKLFKLFFASLRTLEYASANDCEEDRLVYSSYDKVRDRQTPPSCFLY